MKCRALLLFFACYPLGLPPVAADQPDTRHGTTIITHPGYSHEGGFTLIAQDSNNPQWALDLSGSLDLVAHLPMGSGYWTLYVEGSTTPAANGVGAWLPQANADLGSALNAKGHGRVQLSVIHFTHPFAGGALSLGLLDAAGFLDRSEVANDETRQFLALEFVNNPTLKRPDYHLGAAWHFNATRRHPGLTLVAGSSHGLAENGGRYDELVKVSAPDKGLFFAAEGYGYISRYLWRIGLWANTAPTDHQKHHGGVYFNLDGNEERLRWNLRAGAADAGSNDPKAFLALAGETSLKTAALGVGVAWSRFPRAMPTHENQFHIESYLRFDITRNLCISPHLQWLWPSPQDSGPKAIWILGVRLTQLF